MQRAAPCANQCEAQAFKIEIRQLEYQLAEAQEVIRLQVENYDELKEQSDAQHGYFNSVITERDALQSQLEELRFARSPHAKTPILYTDEIGGKQCCRDDLWAIGTAELNELAALRAQEPVSTAMDVTIDDDEALKLLRDMVVTDDGDFTPVRLLCGDGHSGYGLYIASADYQDEGAVLLAPVAVPTSQVPDGILLHTFLDDAKKAGITHLAPSQEPVNQMLLDALKAQHADRLAYSRAKRSANATCADFKTSSLSELIESGYMQGLGKQTESAIAAAEGEGK